MRKIAILTSGGDAPGMNAVVRAVVGVAHGLGAEAVGVRHGYEGLIDGDLRVLRPADVDGWNRRGGSALGSSRSERFRHEAGRSQALAVLAASAIEDIVVIGGNGSLTGAVALAASARAQGQTLRVVGIPASIDNDIAATSLSIGVDTALGTIVECCDKVLDTASSHARTFLVEVMGRDCGYLAMTAAVATGADGVLFPEARLDEAAILDRVVHIVRSAYLPADGRHRVLIIKAEGVALPVETLRARLDARLNDEGLAVETRSVVLGHVVRGGAPSATDRLIAGRLGHAAVRALLMDKSEVMVAWHPPPVGPLPGEALELDPYVRIVPLQQVLAETAAIASGEHPLTEFRARLLAAAEPFLSA
ncbi:MAG: hypothetical protein RIT45_1725 [Pseudomonadota bacterium]